MKRHSRRIAALLVLGAFLALAATSVLATEETEEPPPAVETEEPAPTSDIEPAVEITTPASTEPTPDWTYRYMIPTAIVLALLVVVLTTVRYFTWVVRKRYRIVEE
jgi:hypothetical protein